MAAGDRRVAPMANRQAVLSRVRASGAIRGLLDAATTAMGRTRSDSAHPLCRKAAAAAAAQHQPRDREGMPRLVDKCQERAAAQAPVTTLPTPPLLPLLGGLPQATVAFTWVLVLVGVAVKLLVDREGGPQAAQAARINAHTDRLGLGRHQNGLLRRPRLFVRCVSQKVMRTIGSMQPRVCSVAKQGGSLAH